MLDRAIAGISPTVCRSLSVHVYDTYVSVDLGTKDPNHDDAKHILHNKEKKSINNLVGTIPQARHQPPANNKVAASAQLCFAAIMYSSMNAVAWIATFLLAVTEVSSYNTEASGVVGRRGVFGFLAASWCSAAGFLASTPAHALDDERLTNVYFGCGCFWHVQHEFVQAERSLLGRNDHQLTSAAGYAGGKATDSEGRVCYHNLQFVADYGRLGHGEAVGMTLPENKIADFAQVYFDLFDPRSRDRVDPMDRGPEYRSVMGLPGGRQHPVYPKIEAIASKAGFQLLPGKGDDPDTLGKQTVYLYDSTKFPF